MSLHRISVIDSHTGGEPTRVVIGGGPSLGPGAAADQLIVFRDHYDHFRAAIVNEPRGSDPLVGALLVKPWDKTCVAGAIFFNHAGVLQGYDHPMIGLVATLAHLGVVTAGEHRLETPAGIVTTRLHEDGRVSVQNVPSWRHAASVPIELPGHGTVVGDVAWSGNWFFLTEHHRQELTLSRVDVLTEFARQLRRAVNRQAFAEVDHIELLASDLEVESAFARSAGAPKTAEDQSVGGGADLVRAHGRNFVLGPGNAYERSPCGTGTSARLACLAASGVLQEGAAWIEESLLGSRFTAEFVWEDRAAGRIIPTITGTAHLTAEATLLLDERDPFCWGTPRPARAEALNA